jgi:hypothetical protein
MHARTKSANKYKRYAQLAQCSQYRAHHRKSNEGVVQSHSAFVRALILEQARVTRQTATDTAAASAVATATAAATAAIVDADKQTPIVGREVTSGNVAN